jgi:hypothetical protein
MNLKNNKTIMKPLLFLLLLSSFVSHSVEFSVDTTTDSIDINIGDGLCANSSGDCSLRAAIQETNQLAGADTIYLARSTMYSLNLNAGVNDSDFGDLDISDSLTISIENPNIPAASVSELPLINGNSIDRVFDVSNADAVTFNALYILGGDATVDVSLPSGGAALVDGSVNQFTVQFSVLAFNKANAGAAIESRAVNSLISFTDISYNELKTGALNPQGAALMNRSGDMKIEYSSIHHNTVDDNVIGCTQAIFNLNSTMNMYIFSSTVSDNGVSNSGVKCVSGVSGQNSHLYLVNASIYNNGGSGITFYDFNNNKDLFVRNSIIANNHQQDCSSINTGVVNFGDVNGGNNIVSDRSCLLPVESINMEDTDPLLDSAKNTFPNDALFFIYYEPLPTSPAIDQGSLMATNIGNPNACIQFDQILRVRPLDGDGNGVAICDIGAVENNFDLIFKNSFK